MENHFVYRRKALVVLLFSFFSLFISAQTWDFSSLITSDKEMLDSDPSRWYNDTNNGRYNLLVSADKEALLANDTELAYAKGLLFTASEPSSNTSGKIRLNYKSSRLELNGSNIVITIPEIKAGYQVNVECMTSSSSSSRGLTVTNLTPVSGYFNSTSNERQSNIGIVDTSGDITLTTTGGLYIYSITVIDPSSEPSIPSEDHSTSLKSTENQVRLFTTDNELKYYDIKDISSIDIDNEQGSVTITSTSNQWEDTYTHSVSTISFAKIDQSDSSPEENTSGITIKEAKGWFETAYIEWEPLDQVSEYVVYLKGGIYSDYTPLDTELVRNYGSYYRADALGLSPCEDYCMKVVPIIDGEESGDIFAEVKNLSVKAYDRSGFAHLNYSGVGAYNDDGTLKDNARVIYVTSETAKTITLDVASSNTKYTTYTGLQDIISGFLKGYETRPLAIRVIGTITNDDMDRFDSSSEGLQIKSNKDDYAMNITLEGVGCDATLWGFGILLRNAQSIELRNFGVMLCMDDGISIDTDNRNCWIHNLDLFYGQTGSDGDKAKGDGAIDVKGDSKYITISYNHFFDTGKSSLCGMKSESGPNYISYHHNWFDHSDSRHPRVRTMSVHVWNNYYDGCAKYGIGATTGSSVFVESNFFRHTKCPMLISLQGTDAKGDGTFSSETGGMIKSYNNVYAEKGSSSNYTSITQNESSTSFDCYEVSNRDETVPSSYVTLSGNTPYNNFDTDPSLMYSYEPDATIDLPNIITGWWGAGRIEHGDFSWSFDNNTEDTNSDVNSDLKSALENYTSTLIKP